MYLREVGGGGGGLQKEAQPVPSLGIHLKALAGIWGLQKTPYLEDSLSRAGTT